MIAVLSPAKTLNETHERHGNQAPYFSSEIKQLIKILKDKSALDLSNLMDISSDLAEVNHKRYNNFKSKFTTTNSKAAIFTFNGDVYRGFDVNSLNEKDLVYANDHIRILSGLYGILKPMDKMQSYRLEMGTSLSNDLGNNLYKFWGDKIANKLSRELRSHKSQSLINLASKEYFRAIPKKSFPKQIIHIDFKELRNGELKSISFNAKKARGMMARFMVDNQLENPEDLKSFNVEDYKFDLKRSKDDNWLFIR